MPKKNKIKLANNTLITLINSVISSCDSVCDHYQNIDKRKRNKRIDIRNYNNNLSIDIHVYAYYGHKIADAITYLQDNITKVIEDKTDYEIKEINVYVDGFIEDEKPQIIQEEVVPKIKNAIVATASGNGLIKLFNEYRVDGIVNVENPQKQDYLEIINKIDAENIFILPSNIDGYAIASLCKEDVKNKNIHIVDTKTILEEIKAISCFNKDSEVNDNLHQMKEEISKVTTYSFFFLDEDVEFENKVVKQNSYVGLFNESAICSGKNAKRTLHRLVDDILEVRHKNAITIIVGKDADAKTTAKLCKYVKDYSSLNIKLIMGDQQKYTYLFGLE